MINQVVKEELCGLACDLIMWMDLFPMSSCTPRNLFRYLEAVGRDVPEWMWNELEMKNLDSVPSKTTRAYLIWRAVEEHTKKLTHD